MPVNPYLNPLYAPGAPLNPGPAGPMNDSGPSTINVTDPGRYGTRPAIYGGGMLQGGARAAPTMPPPAAPEAHGGMFANGGKINIAGLIAAGLNGFLAGMPGPSQAVGLAGLKAMQERQQMALEEQVYEHRQNLEMQRQMAMLPYQLQMKLRYPDNADAQTAYQAGMEPGSPQWQQHFQTLSANAENPVVNAGPYGPVLRSQVTGAANARPLTDSDIDHIDGQNGGQTPPASAGFLGAGTYPPIGTYNRY